MTRPVIPQIVLVRVATSGGPYRVGETLSVAYVEASAGRLLAHEPAGTTPLDERDTMLPETISAVVIRAAEPFASGETLAFAFVDPAFARIHRVASPPPLGYVERRDPMRSLADGDSMRAGSALNGLPASAGSPASVTLGASGQKAPANGASPSPNDATGTTALPPSNETGRVSLRLRDPSEAAVAPIPAPRSEPTVSRPADASGLSDLVAAALLPHTAPSRGSVVAAPSPDSVIVAPSPGIPTLVGGSRSDMADASGQLVDARADANGGRDVSGRPMTNDVWSALHEHCEAATADRDRANGPGAGRLAEATYAGLLLRSQWSDDRSRRVAQVTTRLFAIDRLGWFRHALAIRLLLADDIACGDQAVQRDAIRHLHAVRLAANEALGRPLLAASMPNFAVSAAWLESIETPATARALAGLRNAIETSATDDPPPAPSEPRRSLGTIGRSELAAAPAGSVDALLPLLVTTEFASDDVTAAARAYRQEALDAFAQVADASEAVRLNAMARANRALDDRLSVLVRAIGEAHDGLAVA